jgi:hypothetical protein
MYLVGFVLYVVLCVGVAWGLAVAITYRARESWPRWVVAAVLAPTVFFLPLADEIVGHFQFERLCEEAKEVKIYGTIPVGEDLYTPDGKWRLGMPGEDGRRLQRVIDTYLRQERSAAREVPGAIPIRRYEAKVFEAKSGRLLAEWQWYGTSGGWFGRNVVAGELPLIVRPQCMPRKFRQIEPAVLRFSKSSEASK